MKHKSNYLYKYSSVTSFTFKNLILGQLRFNHPTSMNDQLEGMIKVRNTDFTPSQKAINNFLVDKKLNYWWNEKGIEEKGFLDFYMSYWFNYELKKYRVTCFSAFVGVVPEHVRKAPPRNLHTEMGEDRSATLVHFVGRSFALTNRATPTKAEKNDIRAENVRR